MDLSGVDFLGNGSVIAAVGDFSSLGAGDPVTLTDIDFSSPGVIWTAGGFSFTADSFVHEHRRERQRRQELHRDRHLRRQRASTTPSARSSSRASPAASSPRSPRRTSLRSLRCRCPPPPVCCSAALALLGRGRPSQAPRRLSKALGRDLPRLRHCGLDDLNASLALQGRHSSFARIGSLSGDTCHRRDTWR